MLKKFVCLFVILGLCFIAFPAMADYKGKLVDEIRQEIGAFFQRNEGNKITIDVMDGMMLHLNQIFEANLIPKVIKPVKEKAGPVIEKK